MEGEPLIMLVGGGVVSVVFFLIALFRIAESNMTDGMKLGWIITISLIPIAGSLGALTVVKK